MCNENQYGTKSHRDQNFIDQKSILNYNNKRGHSIDSRVDKLNNNLNKNTNTNNTDIKSIITQLDRTPINNIKLAQSNIASHSLTPNKSLKNKLNAINIPIPNGSDRKLLILDLDETLVHSSFKPLNTSPDITLRVLNKYLT